MADVEDTWVDIPIPECHPSKGRMTSYCCSKDGFIMYTLAGIPDQYFIEYEPEVSDMYWIPDTDVAPADRNPNTIEELLFELGPGPWTILGSHYDGNNDAMYYGYYNKSDMVAFISTNGAGFEIEHWSYGNESFSDALATWGNFINTL
jgi:hypothetical protein